MSNPFFKNHGPYKISEIIKSLNVNITKTYKDKDIQIVNNFLQSRGICNE